MVIIIIFILFIVTCIILKRKYNNPFKLIFVFGKKGSGKSCYLVHEIIKHLKKGWIVYSDFPVNINGVRLISFNDLSTFKPVENSLIVLDEVGLSANNRDFKTFSKGLTEYIKLQRHFKVKMIMNSQSFDVDKKIRDCTDSMILQSNILNCISISRPIIRSVTLTEPTSEAESRIADSLKFAKIWNWKFYWMPKYFKYFDSHSVPFREEIPYKEMFSSSLKKDKLKAESALRIIAQRSKKKIKK